MGEASSYHHFRRQLLNRQLGSGYILVGRESYLIDDAIRTLRDALLTDDFTNSAALPREGEALLVDEVMYQVMKLQDKGTEIPTSPRLLLAETEEQQAKLNDARRTAESFDYAAYQGREADVDQILMQVQTSPFVARRRLIVIKQFDEYRKDDQKKLLQAMSREPKACRLVLTAESGDAALAKVISASGCGRFVVELPDTSADDLMQMIDAWARRNRFKVTDDARELLVEVSEESLTRLRSELEKVQTAVGAGDERGAMSDESSTITRDTIRDLAGHWREYEVSEFVDAVVRRNRALALSNLRRLDDWDEEPVKIVAWLAGRFLRMLAYGYGDARLWGKPEIARALGHLAAIDMKLKRGFPEKYYLLESFVIRRTLKR